MSILLEGRSLRDAFNAEECVAHPDAYNKIRALAGYVSPHKENLNNASNLLISCYGWQESMWIKALSKRFGGKSIFQVMLTMKLVLCAIMFDSINSGEVDHLGLLSCQ